MYTREQVRIARENITIAKQCPKWLQEMFESAPWEHTIAKCESSWNSGFCGDSREMVYPISDEWSPESEIISEITTKLQNPVKMLVSDDGHNWFKKDVIGQLGGKFLVLRSHTHHTWWNHAKEIPEAQKFTITVTIPSPIDEIRSSTILDAVGDGISEHLKVKSIIEVKKV